MSMHVEASVEIPAPIDQVWQITQDPQLRTHWDARVARYEVHGPAREGTEITITLKMGLLRPRAKERLLRWAPPFQSVLQTEPENSVLIPPGAGSWTFAATETGTRFTTRFTFDDSRLHPLIPKRMYRWIVAWDTQRSLNRLRAFVRIFVRQDPAG